MLDFILEFLQAVFGKGEKQLDAFGGRFRVADFVGFEGAQIIFLLRRLHVQQRKGQKQARTDDRGWEFVFHGCFSGGGVGCLSAGRWGKSSRISSSSMAIKSWRTICSGGL